MLLRNNSCLVVPDVLPRGIMLKLECGFLPDCLCDAYSDTLEKSWQGGAHAWAQTSTIFTSSRYPILEVKVTIFMRGEKSCRVFWNSVYDLPPNVCIGLSDELSTPLKPADWQFVGAALRAANDISPGTAEAQLPTGLPSSDGGQAAQACSCVPRHA